MKAPLTEAETTVSNDQRPCAVLIVSARMEHRRTLLRILEGLNIDVLVCSTLAQARVALSKRTAALSFCDEKLPDGTYSDFLELQDRKVKKSRVIVTMMNDKWERYLEAIRLGAFDVLQFPFAPTDVELSLIHAMRKGVVYKAEDTRLKLQRGDS
jgi:DNA-binding NtrC family response regulator